MPEKIMVPIEAIQANARLVVDQLGPVSELVDSFGYNRESVEWVEDYIERERTRSDFSKEDVSRLVQVLASFLGECVIRVYGGEWREREGMLGVFFGNANGVFPFAKVRKQFDNGRAAGDSILSFFDLIKVVILQKLQ